MLSFSLKHQIMVLCSKISLPLAIINNTRSIIRPYLNYDDVVYDQAITFFCQQIASIQYNASLAITEAIKGTTSKFKLYSEIGLGSLKLWQWFRKLCTFYRIENTYLTKYLFDLFQKAVMCTIFTEGCVNILY